MSAYDLGSGNFVPVTEKHGILQNLCMTTLEYVTINPNETPVADTGLKLKPNEKMKFELGSDQLLYIRAVVVNQYSSEQQAIVEPLGKEDGYCCCCKGDSTCGGEIADDDDIDGILNGYDLADDNDIDSLFNDVPPPDQDDEDGVEFADDDDIDSLF